MFRNGFYAALQAKEYVAIDGPSLAWTSFTRSRHDEGDFGRYVDVEIKHDNPIHYKTAVVNEIIRLVPGNVSVMAGLRTSCLVLFDSDRISQREPFKNYYTSAIRVLFDKERMPREEAKQKIKDYISFKLKRLMSVSGSRNDSGSRKDMYVEAKKLFG